jgi:hypothetical protein
MTTECIVHKNNNNINNNNDNFLSIGKKLFDVDNNYACAKCILWTATKHLHLNLIFTLILRFALLLTNH